MPRAAFDKMDADLIRVLEDLVFVLIDKGVITLAELPPHAQAKLLNRKGFRDRMHTHVSNAKNAEFSVTLDDSKFGLLR
jgi:ssDNA-specific exonuclease RecJ